MKKFVVSTYHYMYSLTLQEFRNAVLPFYVRGLELKL